MSVQVGRDSDGGHGQLPVDIFGAPQRDGRPVIDWRDAFRILRRRIWFAAFVFAAVFIGTVLNALTRVPVYEAKARVLVESGRGNVTGLKDPLEDDPSTATDFQTQLMILQSRSLARKTMQALGIWNRPAPARSASAPGRPAPGSVSALVAAGKEAVHNVSAWIWPPAAPAGFALDPKQQESAEETAQINAFLSGLRVTPIPGTRLVDIYYVSTDPPAAATNANTLVAQFIQQNLEFKFLASKEVTDWLSDRLTDQRKALEASEQALQSYRASHNIVGTLEQPTLQAQKLTDLTTAFTKAKTERIEKEALAKQLDSIKTDRAAADTIPAIVSNPVVQQLKSELVALQRQHAQIAEKFGERHPSFVKSRDAVQAADARLQAEVARVVKSVRNEYVAARSAEASLGEALDAQKRETAAHNGGDVEFVLLQRDAESNRQIWQSLQQRVNEFAVTSERRSSSIRVLDPAETPQSPLGTGVQRDIRYGALGGLFLGICVAFLLEYLDSHVKTPDQIVREFGIPFLGLVPLVARGASPDAPLVQPALPQVGGPFGKNALPGFGEAFRKLRTNVRLSITTTGTHTILVTSAGAGEGKTLVASNLAATIALADQQVLLIDADLRRPRLHRIFDVAQEPGLSNLLAGTAPGSECVRRTAIKGLHVLPSGTLPPNPSELLDSARFKDFLAHLGKYFDWVVLDSPPVLPVTDAMVLSQHVGGVVFVVSADLTPLHAAKGALEQLLAARAHMLGAVLNRADLEHRGYYYAKHYREEDEQYYIRTGTSA